MADMSEVKMLIQGLSDRELATLLEKIGKKVPVPVSETIANAWYDQHLTGLNKEGKTHLAELKRQMSDSGTTNNVDKKLVRYLEQLNRLRLEVPPLFRSVVDPKSLYKHLVSFCDANDIPGEIVASVVPALITYMETGHMRPIIFVGEKGCGKTTAVRLLVKEALKIPTEVIKIPQIDGSHGMTGDCGTYKAADVGCIAKARLRSNSLLVAYIFDEIDKAAHGFNRSNVEDELLSITDESCDDVTDNYLETTLVGLEHCPMFFTANNIENVSPILADRCSVIRFPNANASRIKSIGRKYVGQQLSSRLYSAIDFNYNLMDKHIEKLIQNNITSIRKHQQLIESVLGNALNIALIQDVDEPVPVTEEMFVDAEQAVFGSEKPRIGF